MRIEEIRKLTNEEIEKEIKDLKKKLFDLRLEQATGKLTNTAEISKTKKTIARLSTVLTERANA
ncbi:MAG: 50S ribosomal protein L29 [Gammaproteobacteria bacterium]|jgi:large subunit ribosomal protein L29|nr:50S ribosomal protein L29 [Gammaproteobacteria bacterium]